MKLCLMFLAKRWAGKLHCFMRFDLTILWSLSAPTNTSASSSQLIFFFYVYCITNMPHMHDTHINTQVYSKPYGLLYVAFLCTSAYLYSPVSLFSFLCLGVPSTFLHVSLLTFAGVAHPAVPIMSQGLSQLLPEV